MLVVHMWLCLRRLKAEGKDGVELGQYVYEIYNHDLELRVAKAGVSSLLLYLLLNPPLNKFFLKLWSLVELFMTFLVPDQSKTDCFSDQNCKTKS